MSNWTRRVALAGTLATVLLAADSHAAIVQWQVADGGNGHYYELVGNYLDTTQRWNWETSKVMAEARTHLGIQGHLATVGSAAENQFLIDSLHVLSKWPTWIGLTDSELFGGHESFGQPNPQVDGWAWITGEPVTFTGWYPGSPENTNDEDFALMGSQHGEHSLWNDAQSGTGGDAQFFVEYEPAQAAVPEPSSGILVAGLLAIFAVRLRRRPLK
jgi:hypothetical protein